ncbi:ATP-dependent DNA helicase srs2 [Psilocybe cubensis]|uniref:ATP-dependent DNA helicase srs2 n=2 Tax=Psilocybe cubensis TaxID=181762 RepID=A0ACB8H0M9_PSICU|nr:ATP-dependent DNA helicase srs2 [Psilocybe cubensis]KAH9481404.1 ATP-dependent DNA helicase srs2 [Psilocybe cubensis]
MNTPASGTDGITSAQPSQSDSATCIENILAGLNPAQLKAVQHDPAIPLQILAGPGSGKTKVLTARIARLIITHEISPSSICAVTFTNKAANEMRDRLTKLIGKRRTAELKMGTFHSVCVRYLRMYAAAVNLDSNFTICDADDSKKLLSALMKPYAEYMANNDITLSEGTVSSFISKSKAKGQTAALFFKEVEHDEGRSSKVSKTETAQEEKKSIQRIIAEVYIGYEQVLKANNALDFDDLLVYGVKLFSTHTESVLWCKHILVDEFQDTNTMQYELMKAIGYRRCVTIVGDPDQSIYGWRSAEVINLSRMRNDFRNTVQVFLEQNYRSTASILRACLAVVSEDKKRIPKSLHTNHPLGATPFVGTFETEKEEASFVASEIKRCVANMGGVLKWGDFVVLLRFNALSRPIESALQKQGIPCRILGGHKFFERMEVKDILAYLQLVDNPSFNPAFIRAIKVPSRGMGEKSLSELAIRAQELKISQLELVERIHDNKASDIKPPIKKKITSFVKSIRCMRRLDQEKIPPSDLIRKLLDMIQYEDHLRKTQQDWDSRWENVQELITFANEIEADALKSRPPFDELAPEQQSERQVLYCSMLRDFLQASTLSSEGDNDSEDQAQEKVTLSTCHAAKGLEWPVVMVPSVDQETFPFYRTEDIDEERRLLYVAFTRAKSLLYVLMAEKRVVAGKTKSKRLSNFVASVRGKDESLFSCDVPRFLPEDRAVVSKVLDRCLPEDDEINRRLNELESDGSYVQPTFQTRTGEMVTVSLQGVRSKIQKVPNDSAELAAMYAAPETLAAISATFTRDFKKCAFSRPTKPLSSSNTLSTAFTTFAGVHKHTPQINASTLKPQKGLNSGSFISPHTVGTSIPGGHRGYISGQKEHEHQTHSQTLDHNKPPSYFSKGSAVIHKPPANPVLPHLVAAATVSLPSSSAVPGSRNNTQVEPFYYHNRRLGESSLKPGPCFSLKQAIVHGSNEDLSDPDYDMEIFCSTPDVPKSSNAPPPPRHSSTPNATAKNDVPVIPKYQTGISVTEHRPAAANIVLAQPKKGPPMPSSIPSVVTEIPSLNKGVPRTEPSQSSHIVNPILQPTGVKRRLGMGRSTTGYSNKKFKKPL